MKSLQLRRNRVILVTIFSYSPEQYLCTLYNDSTPDDVTGITNDRAVNVTYQPAATNQAWGLLNITQTIADCVVSRSNQV